MAEPSGLTTSFRRRRILRPNFRVLGIYLTGVFVGALDTNILGPAFPLIAKGFHTSLEWTAWTLTAYTAAYVASTVMAGAIGDRYGRKRLFSLGVLLFGLASALAAYSPSFWVFILARIIQGAGAGAVYPNAQAEGISIFPADRRGVALGIFGAVFGLASIIGPNVGGALAQFYGWQAIFLINIPIALAVLVAARKLPESAPSRGQGVPDLVGGISFALFLTMALLTLSVTSSFRFAFLALALVFIGIFLRRQKTSALPFLDTKPLSNRSGLSMMVGAALIGLNLSAAVFVPTLAQLKLHMGVFASGVALMPAAFTGAVLAGLGGVLVDRIGPRSVIQVGLVAAVLGGLLLATPSLTLTIFILAMVFLGFGTAFTMGAPLNRMALALYRDDQAGEALSLVAVFRAVGLAAGPILLTLALSWKGFTAMFALVAASSLIAAFVFFAVPDVRPAPRVRRSRAS